MGWAIGYDSQWDRDIGYGVPATCDYPSCNKKIDRGLSYVCAGQQPYGGEAGCGLYFCGKHMLYRPDPNDIADGIDEEEADWIEMCERCAKGEVPFKAKPDRPIWIRWKLKNNSWQEWRDENPKEVEKMKALLRK